MQNGDKAVDPVDVEETWQLLAARVGSQLIDVRTRAEWAYVGIPDLGPLGKRAVLVEWQTFPDQTVDPRFAERLASELGALAVQLDDDLFFICRSGSRSLAAAKAMAAAGYLSEATAPCAASAPPRSRLRSPAPAPRMRPRPKRRNTRASASASSCRATIARPGINGQEAVGTGRCQSAIIDGCRSCTRANQSRGSETMVEVLMASLT